MASPELIAQLKRHEGLRLFVYCCTAGRRTIGYGHNLDANPLSAEERKVTGYRDGVISAAGADWLLQRDVERTERALIERLPWVANLDPVRRDALVNMAFQMGVAGLCGWKTTLNLLRSGQWGMAAERMAATLWARQTPARAKEIIAQMKTGNYQPQEKLR